MHTDGREPFLNAQFRVEIEGLSSTGVVEVVFPEARIMAGRGKARRVQYGPLTLRRGMTGSSDWYRWWDRAREAAAAPKRIVIVLMDRFQADVSRWTYAEALPAAYTVSPLNALRGELLIETLELSVGGFSLAFGAAGAPPDRHPAAGPKPRSRPRGRR